MKRYYTMQTNEDVADIYIFGDILEPTSKEFFGVDADVSGYSLVQDIKRTTASKIHVHIDSYGGHVSEGWAIYNELYNHPAEVTTIAEGFACSAASLVFMAGKNRIMRTMSGLWIHEVQSTASGNADDKRKAADEDEAMTKISAQAYLKHISIPEAQLMDMLKRETWIFPADALEMGFATTIEDGGETDRPTQSVRQMVFNMLTVQPLSLTSIEKKLDAILAMKSDISTQKTEGPPKQPEAPAQTYNFFKKIKGVNE